MPTDQTFLFDEGRVLSWFSCGAASAVATKLAITKHGSKCIPVYCDLRKSEQSDNQRFINDCEKWFGCPVTIIRSELYDSVDDVVEKTRYMSGPEGARCTTELKKLPRHKFARPEDTHIFGFTADESVPYVKPGDDRIADFERNNPELFLEWILRDNGVTKQMCYQMVMSAGIKLPEMYLMGYPHNNCPGCLKASSAGYWNKIRVDFPAVFAMRVKQSRELGVRLVQYDNKRIFLDELPPHAKGRWKDEKISCGPDCGQSKVAS